MADICSMTRKTRTRQTRIHAALQSGYCAICHLPYNSLDDHIQSKKHLKLIGEDANYISINGFIDQNSLEPFLNLNGIDSIDVNGRQLEKDFCPRTTRMNNRNRGMSVDRIPPSPIDSPIHHHLRSRKQINYAMSPSMDEDSFSERPDLLLRTMAKEKKSNGRISTKKTQDAAKEQPNAEVWNSGRPKRRSCIKSKRTSADERLVVDNQTYYKVEVMTNKLRSSAPTKEHHEVKQSSEPRDGERDEKGLIVKFKKLRNSEITLLNNEAENFLFPKKDDSSSSEDEEDEDIDADGANTTVSSCEGRNDSYLPSSDNEEDKTCDNFKTDDEASMDSSTSSGNPKKRRRTHAEAFIMDNEKYYKFETPGSRLRYHGSFFPEQPDIKSPKHNGDIEAKIEKKEIVESKEKRQTVNLDNYKFSFEMIPSGEKWFAPFRRQDLGEESYMYLPDIGNENRFILPYQISSIPPLDPKICIAQYSQLKKMVQENSSRTSCSTPDRSETNYTPSFDNEPMDEDSKSSEPGNSIDFCSENSNSEDFKSTDVQGKTKLQMGRNPRKSPRQHASTLAILSSLIHQRKKKSKLNEAPGIPPSNPTIPKPTNLPTIPEEDAVPPKPSRVGYEDILVSMDQELDTQKLLEDLDFCPEESVEFSHKLGILDVLRIYDEMRKKDDYRNNRRFISGPPVNKCGRRKKINKTGWPNRKKGLNRKDTNVKEETSSVGSANDSEEEPSTTDCNKDINKLDDRDVVNRNCDLNRVSVERNTKTPRGSNRVKVSNVNNNKTVNLQPFVKVKKLDSGSVVKKEDNISLPSKRTNKRRMPASPKSPRMLRKPRGRWYKER